MDASVSTGRKSLLLLGFGGLPIALLLSAVITLGSLTLPFEPRQWDLYALTVFIVSALLVFVVILTRSLLRLWSEQRAHQPGSRFKTKMVLKREPGWCARCSDQSRNKLRSEE